MLKRVVLIAALAALVLPAAAFADGITFGFIGGHMYAVQPANSGGGVLGSIATNDPNAVPPQTPPLANARLNYTSKFSGNTIPAGPAVPPQIAPTFGSLTYPNAFNFGSVQWTTGAAIASSIGANSSSVTYDPGGSSVIVYGNGVLPGTGSPLFVGSFIGPTTLTSTGAPHNPICTNCNFWYNLTGPVSGTIDPGLMALLGLGNSQTGNGLFFSLVVGFVGPDDTVGQPEGGTLSVVVPEPGTLALFGTGLIGLAGLIRRKIKA
jgi:hypothetical protein